MVDKNPTELNSRPVRLTKMPQLDGLRAFCLLSIIIHHWTIREFHMNFPFEIGAFVFFSLSGYLITRILLRGRQKISARTTTFGHFIKSFTYRRLLRLFPAYFTALLLYLIILSPEVTKNFIWYITNTSNFHFAQLEKWPGDADQFWTLAVDQQFYALWPFLIIFLPRKTLPAALIIVAAFAPISRLLGYHMVPTFYGPLVDKLPWFLTDHLCLGALLAYAQEYWRLPAKRNLWIVLLGSLTLYIIFRYRLLGLTNQSLLLIFQQTILAIFSTTLVALTVVGFGGLGKQILEHPVVQYLGKRSYGYYLYHNLAFLLLGFIMPFLFWEYPWDFINLPFRIIFSAGLLFLMGHWSWKYIEEPCLNQKKKHRYQPQ